MGFSDWHTETCWFGFYAPERSLGGCLYAFLRPGAGISGGGAVIWDASAHVPWEIPFFDYQWELPLGSGSYNIDEEQVVKFPVGLEVTCTDPNRRYRVNYTADDLHVNITFEGLTPPSVFRNGAPPFDSASHLDQPGRVRGTALLHGEKISIDCFAMRDRSIGPRSDLRGVRAGYAFATASESSAFLAFTRPKDDGDTVRAGYLLEDGVRSSLIDGERSIIRDERLGCPLSVRIDAVDELGRSLQADGTCVSRVSFTPYPRMLTWTSMVRWTFAGETCWGEDQDVWRVDQWRTFRRAWVNTE